MRLPSSDTVLCGVLLILAFVVAVAFGSMNAKTAAKLNAREEMCRQALASTLDDDRDGISTQTSSATNFETLNAAYCRPDLEIEAGDAGNY